MEPTSLERRGFLKQTAGLAAGAAAATTLLAGLHDPEPAAAAGTLPDPALNDTLRMYADLGRALAKPVAQRKWGMVIDVRKCIGCSACTVACIAENNLPPGVTYRVVPEVEDGEYPKLKRFFMPTNCMQCDNPPCMEAANAIAPGAVEKRPDGIVALNYKKFKGERVFKAAKKACPYTALYYDRGENYTDGTPAVQAYEQRATSEYGQPLTRKDAKGTGRKCHFCLPRLEAGMLPACVTTCTGQAMHFGDLSDAESLVTQLLTRHASIRLGESEGTAPRVYYLDDEPQNTCARCHE